MGNVVRYGSVSVDGFIMDNADQPGVLFDWLAGGEVPLDQSGVLKVSRASSDYTRAYWDRIGATIVVRHVFDTTEGWDGTPPGGVENVVVATHRPRPAGWDPEAPFHFVDGQVLAAGLLDEVRMDVAPVVFGSGKRYVGSFHAQHLLEDPDLAIHGNRVLHLRFRVRR
ncbi:dihydrofolate reductase [Arthrobacter sp. AQ5-05]|uniref:dihydrofolate reductase n=1 Tax=Arthrobacter sp. AQ5-05 TaxID=2184581 RepID=UPI000DCE3796|nr:dihydrofolate reductase [Arthrobacter sp. AQ5-05]RAX49682.1 dihydrofolate reductase [Arthrobacter sp. AQ5-05]